MPIVVVHRLEGGRFKRQFDTDEEAQRYVQQKVAHGGYACAIRDELPSPSSTDKILIDLGWLDAS